MKKFKISVQGMSTFTFQSYTVEAESKEAAETTAKKKSAFSAIPSIKFTATEII